MGHLIEDMNRENEPGDKKKTFFFQQIKNFQKKYTRNAGTNLAEVCNEGGGVLKRLHESIKKREQKH